MRGQFFGGQDQYPDQRAFEMVPAPTRAVTEPIEEVRRKKLEVLKKHGVVQRSDGSLKVSAFDRKYFVELEAARPINEAMCASLLCTCCHIFLLTL